MARDQAPQEAEKKIEAAQRTGATELDLSCSYNAKDSEKLTEVPESLGRLTQLKTLNLSGQPTDDAAGAAGSAYAVAGD